MATTQSHPFPSLLLPLISSKPLRHNTLSSSASPSRPLHLHLHLHLKSRTPNPKQQQRIKVTRTCLQSNETLYTYPDPRHHLRISVDTKHFTLAKAIHAWALKFDRDTKLSNDIIIAYIKLGLLEDAHALLSTVISPNVVSYTALISAFAKEWNQEDEAVELFFRMRTAGILPNEYTFVAILTACSRLLDQELGAQIHALAIKTGFIEFVYVSNAVMGVYVKCKDIDCAIRVFDEMPGRDLPSYNTLISGLVKEWDYERAFEYFRIMQENGVLSADHFTVSTLLTASAESFARMSGREIHAYALRSGFWSNLSVNNALIGFYTKCGMVKDVVALFNWTPVKDVITWTETVIGFTEFGMVDSAVKLFEQMPEKNCISYNSLLKGFCKNGEGSRALELFQKMLEEELELSEFTLTSVVNACALLAEVEISKQVHAFVTKSGFGSNPWIEAALLDMCTRCQRLLDARKMFNQWSYTHILPAVWTSMICGYRRNGQPDEAVSLFCSVLAEGDVYVDIVATTAVLGVCGTLGLHEMGMQIHGYAVKSGLESDLGVGNAIFSMYWKCDRMKDAVKSFNLMPEYDLVSWNSLITGYIIHRCGDDALDVWSKMESIGVLPDSTTFALVLSAYRHTNLDMVDSCRGLFLSMKNTYNVEPTSEHYASVVGVLSYWDYYDEAEELISNMPFEPDASVWRALLDSCRLRSKTGLGKQVAKRLLELEPQDSSTYILVANLYSASGRWSCADRVREEMRKKGFQKYPSRSWIVNQNQVHSFYTRDKSHSQTKDIYSGLDILILECLKAGYVPDTSFVLQEVDELQKTDFLSYHSAKLAVTYGILTIGQGKPIRVVKNIHLCGDCHTFFKHVSTVTRREIILRDASGFHYFKNGVCSCKDYW